MKRTLWKGVQALLMTLVLMISTLVSVTIAPDLALARTHVKLASSARALGVSQSISNIVRNQSTSIPIDNASFESPVTNTYTHPIDSWTSNTNNDVWRITSRPQSYGSTPPPDGDQIGAVAGGYLSQILSSNLLPNTTYTLKVFVGYRADFPPPTDKVELLAGGTVLVSEDPVTSLVQGDFIEVTLSYTSPAEGSLIGEPLEIRLSNTSDSSRGNFDYVRLEAVSTTPATPIVVKCFEQVPGFNAQYFNNKDLQGPPTLTRIDDSINFDWGNGSPDDSINADDFSARWIGKITPQYSGTYTLITTSDDGVRVWVNDQLVIDNWTVHSSTNNQGSIDLTEGEEYEIWVEYFENTGLATIKLYWYGPRQEQELVPAVAEQKTTCPSCE